MSVLSLNQIIKNKLLTKLFDYTIDCSINYRNKS